MLHLYCRHTIFASVQDGNSSDLRLKFIVPCNAWNGKKAMSFLCAKTVCYTWTIPHSHGDELISKQILIFMTNAIMKVWTMLSRIGEDLIGIQYPVLCSCKAFQMPITRLWKGLWLSIPQHLQWSGWGSLHVQQIWSAKWMNANTLCSSVRDYRCPETSLFSIILNFMCCSIYEGVHVKECRHQRWCSTASVSLSR